MKQDEFERLNKIVTAMEADVQNKDDEMMIDAVRASIGILERFVVAVEKIAAQGQPVKVTATGQPHQGC